MAKYLATSSNIAGIWQIANFKHEGQILLAECRRGDLTLSVKLYFNDDFADATIYRHSDGEDYIVASSLARLNRFAEIINESVFYFSD